MAQIPIVPFLGGLLAIFMASKYIPDEIEDSNAIIPAVDIATGRKPRKKK